MYCPGACKCEQLHKRIAELKLALLEIADSYTTELYDRPLAFKMSRMARKALTSDKP